MSVSVQRPLMVPVLLLKVMCMSGKSTCSHDSYMCRNALHLQTRQDANTG